MMQSATAQKVYGLIGSVDELGGSMQDCVCLCTLSPTVNN